MSELNYVEIGKKNQNQKKRIKTNTRKTIRNNRCITFLCKRN